MRNNLLIKLLKILNFRLALISYKVKPQLSKFEPVQKSSQVLPKLITLYLNFNTIAKFFKFYGGLFKYLPLVTHQL